jgi:hypothetical protein
MLVLDALFENDRKGSRCDRFDAAGFADFFASEDPDIVQEAWKLYDGIRPLRRN